MFNIFPFVEMTASIERTNIQIKIPAADAVAKGYAVANVKVIV